MKKIILDCDPGMDDSMAIAMAVRSPALELLGVTATMGNYPVSVTAKNARKMLELLGRGDIPVAQGASRPLDRPAPRDPFTHGADGQAENFLPEPAMPLTTLDAAAFIIETVRHYPDELTILCTGPMTNLATAIRRAPEISSRIAEVIAISGAFGWNACAFTNATGDTPMSEWNVYVDPAAADIVYRSGIPLVALGLDVATHFSVNISDDEIAALAQSARPEAQFLTQAIRFVTARGFQAYCTVIDCMSVAFAIDRTLVETVRGRVGVETKEGLTRGMTVVDRRHHHIWEHLPEIEMGRDADYRRFIDLLLDCVLGEERRCA